MAGLSLPHVYQPGPVGAARRTLLMLHAAGGGERDLLALAGLLQPGVAMLSPRGSVREGTGWRFFRRLAPRVDDLEDLQRCAARLAAFVADAVDHHGLDTGAHLERHPRSGLGVAYGFRPWA